ncbi:phage filamentation protein Fil family protein [Brenneria uluponensis]|uniref:phage filamentation protein Fil family protein n=1 Tax=Brenneria uluponensis TaxID=3057057 RepID=UPI0028EFB182|nr:phage filamentation protein Fil family protein [Brenneria ulupoensis]
MISIARLLKVQSPAPQPNKGWLELPNGQRFQPTPAQVYFAPWSKKPYMPAPTRRRWFARLMGIAA